MPLHDDCHAAQLDSAAKYQKERERDALNLTSASWLAVGWEYKPWEVRGFVTAITHAQIELEMDEAVDFATAVLFDIWRA